MDGFGCCKRRGKKKPFLVFFLGEVLIVSQTTLFYRSNIPREVRSDGASRKEVQKL